MPIVPTVQFASFAPFVPFVAFVFRILSLVILGPAIAVAVTWAAARTTAPMQIALWVALASSVLIVAPAFAWAVDHGRTRLPQIAFLGAACGALPPLLTLISGAIGLFLASSMSFRYLRWTLGYGVSVPGYGIVLWRDFLWIAALSVLIGLTVGIVFRLVFLPSRPGRLTGGLLACATIAAALATAGTLLRIR